MLELGFEVALVNSLLLATLRVLSSSPDVPNVENSACFDNTHTKIGTNSENGGRRASGLPGSASGQGRM